MLGKHLIVIKEFSSLFKGYRDNQQAVTLIDSHCHETWRMKPLSEFAWRKSSVDNTFQTMTETYFYHMPVLLRKMVLSTSVMVWVHNQRLAQWKRFAAATWISQWSHLPWGISLLNITLDSSVVWHINRKSIAIKLQWSNFDCWEIKTESESHGFPNTDERWQKTTAMLKEGEQLKSLHGSSFLTLGSVHDTWGL